MRLGDVATVRSKNAGPFWITIDVFAKPETFEMVRAGLSTASVAAALHQPPERIARHDIAALSVVKLSLPRPHVQGSAADRDMHGAQLAIVVAGLPIEQGAHDAGGSSASASHSALDQRR